MTTKQVQRIGALYDQGMTDVAVGKLVGCATTSVWSWRKARGKPPNGRGGKAPQFEFRIYDARTSQLLAMGTARECTEMLGLASLNCFFATVSRCWMGKTKKYVVRQERLPGADNME